MILRRSRRSAGLEWPRPRCGVQAVDAVDECGVSVWVGLYELAAHVFRDARRQSRHRGRFCAAFCRLLRARVAVDLTQQIARRERLSEHDHDPRPEHRLAIEVEADRDERYCRAAAFRVERHARGARPERLEAAGGVADSFRKDADGVPGGECGRHGGERLDVLGGVHALIHLAIDRNRAGAAQHRSERAVEERRLGEEAHVALGRRPDERGIEQGIGMVGEEQHRTLLGDASDAVGAVENPAYRLRQPADGRIAPRRHRQAACASACRAARRPASTSTNTRIAAPITKKPSTASMALRLCPVASTIAAKTSGPRIPA